MFHRMVVSLAMWYWPECWVVKKQRPQKMSMAEMEMLRWMSGINIKDQLRNEFIRNRLGVTLS